MRKKTKKVNKRLLKHADFLASLKPRKLDMGDIATTDDDGNMNPFKCSSVACVMGWTPAVFPRIMEWRIDTSEGAADVVHKRTGSMNFAAMGELFDVPMGDADVLFGSGGPGYRTKTEVVRGLRQYAKTGKLPFEERGKY
jgi:hypothetical protein